VGIEAKEGEAPFVLLLRTIHPAPAGVRPLTKKSARHVGAVE